MSALDNINESTNHFLFGGLSSLSSAGHIFENKISKTFKKIETNNQKAYDERKEERSYHWGSSMSEPIGETAGDIGSLFFGDETIKAAEGLRAFNKLPNVIRNVITGNGNKLENFGNIALSRGFLEKAKNPDESYQDQINNTARRIDTGFLANKTLETMKKNKSIFNNLLGLKNQ